MLKLNVRLCLSPVALTCFLLSPAKALIAQAAAKPPVRRAAPTAARKPAVTAAKPVSDCVSLPTLSEKIPVVPAGKSCAKSLYTLKFEAAHLDPQVSGPLRTSLESLNQSFSLDYIDTKIGTGELAQPKKYYTVNYTGYLVDGTKFDSSLDPGKEPFVFPYGAHRVIQGWDTGFEGMRAGGKRRLFVPYQLGYGERGQPPTIPAKALLVFDVEFVSQSDAPPTPPAPPAPPAGSAAPGSAPSDPPSGTAPGSTPPPADAPPPSGGDKPAAPQSTPPPPPTKQPSTAPPSR